MVYRKILNFSKTRTKYFYLLASVILTITLSHLLYTLATQQQPEMDEQHYLDMATTFYKLLQTPDFSTPIKILQHIPFRQPGYPLLILPLYLIFGISHSYSIALFMNVLFYIITILGVYFLAKEYFSRESSFLASLIFTCYGWSLFYLHFAYSETATTTFVLLSLLFLKRSENFTKKWYSIFFGIFLGLGFLTRWVTVFFIVGPLAFSIFNLVKNKNKKVAIKNLLLSSIFTFLIGSPPYIVNFNTFFGDYFKSQAFGGILWDALPAEKKSFISFRSAAYYFKVFEQLTFPLFSLFIGGLIYSTIKFKKYTFLLFAFAAPYLFFSFGTIIKDDRYIVPIYPILALISVSYLDNLKGKIKLLLILAILVISVGNFFGAVWGFGPLGQKGLASTLLPMPIGHARYVHWTTIVWPPNREISNARRVINLIEANTASNNPQILQLFSYHPVDIGIYSQNQYHRTDKMNFVNFVGGQIQDPETTAKYVIDVIKKSEFAITKTRTKIDSYFPQNNYILLENILIIVNDKTLASMGYKTIGVIPVPYDNSYVSVYKKTNELKNSNNIEQQLIAQFQKNISK